MKTRKLTVLSAVKFEAEQTLRTLDDLGVVYDYIEVGIGPIHSARSSSSLNLKGKNVLFIGSCGVFKEDLDVKLVSVSKVIWSPPSVRNGSSELIEGIEPEIRFPNLSGFSASLEAYICACSPSVTLDENLVPEQPKAIENLELYSVAHKLLEAKQLTILFGITNKVHSSGRAEWKENFKKIGTMTSDAIKKAIEDGSYEL